MRDRRRSGQTIAFIVMAAGAGAWLAACFPAELPTQPSLAGSIYAARSGKLVTSEEVLAEVSGADFVLLGETHDNAEHHRIQARLIRAIAQAGRRPAIVLEMLSADQAPALTRHLSEHPNDAPGLGPAVGWERSGWPSWDKYLPIGEAALSAGLTIVAGGLGRPTLMTLRGPGLAGLPPALVGQLGLDVEYQPWQRRELERLLQESHCNELPATTLARMVTIQQARDGALASAMRAGDRRSSGGAVLIAGSGHARNDFGVPWHMSRVAPNRSILVVALIEFDPAKPDAAGYARAADGAPLFDYIWFTAPVVREDPCAGRQRPGG